MYFKVFILYILIFLSLTVDAKQECKDTVPVTTPESRFIMHKDGTVTDTQTQLMWMRCSIGQVWQDKEETCIGEAQAFTWLKAGRIAQDIDFAEYNNWRVPSVKELASIVEGACYKPAINLVIFPETPKEWFWSASLYAGNTKEVWGIDFSNGNDFYNLKMDRNYIRLVRRIK